MFGRKYFLELIDELSCFVNRLTVFTIWMFRKSCWQLSRSQFFSLVILSGGFLVALAVVNLLKGKSKGKSSSHDDDKNIG